MLLPGALEKLVPDLGEEPTCVGRGQVGWLPVGCTSVRFTQGHSRCGLLGQGLLARGLVSDSDVPWCEGPGRPGIRVNLTETLTLEN